MICFDSGQIFKEFASLSFQVSWWHQFLTEVKKFLDSAIFRLGLSNFQIGAWFPFDAFQFNKRFTVYQDFERERIQKSDKGNFFVVVFICLI